VDRKKNFEGFIGIRLQEDMRKGFFEKARNEGKKPSELLRTFINRYIKKKM